MRRVLARLAFVAVLLPLPAGGHASQLAFTVESADPRLPRGFGALDLRVREYVGVFVDGQRAGDSLDLRAHGGLVLPPGTYEIALYADASTGCEPLRGSAEIEAGHRTTALVLEDGTIARGDALYMRGCSTRVRVLAPPFRNATVLVDGKYAGHAGEEIRVKSGARRFEVEAWEAGERPRRWRFDAVLEIQTSPDVVEFWVPLRRDDG